MNTPRQEETKKREVNTPTNLRVLTLKKSSKQKPSHNTDGGKTNYYNIPDSVNDVDDLAEYLDLRGDEFNVLKALFGIAVARKKGIARHQGTEPKRDAKKLKHYSKRIYKRISKC